MINRFATLILLLLLSSFGAETHASHYHDVTLTYECQSSNVFQVSVWFYRDCQGSAVGAPTNLLWTGNGASCSNPTTTGWTQIPAVEITPISPGIQTTCQGGTFFDGVEEVRYIADFDFSATNCTEYDFSWEACCRAPNLTAIVGFPSTYVSAGTIRPGQATCNSSPNWRHIPIVYVWQGGQNIFDTGAEDPDGDSLVYSMHTCMGGAATPVTYQPGFSLAQPLGSSWDVQLDSKTGLMTFDPIGGQIQAGLICVKAEEYRNGVKIGEINRDMTVEVITGQPFVNGARPDHQLTNPQNGFVVAAETLVVAPGSPFCVDVAVDDPDPNVGAELRIIHCLPGAVVSDTFNTAMNPVFGEDVHARLCWTAPASGTYEFVAEAIDTACTINVQTVRTYTIIVGDTGLVWPGDANDDNVANNFDLLALGLAFGQNGYERSLQGNAWQGHMSIPWGDTIAGGIDYKYQDCNGDSTVDADDTLAITLNYGLTHTKHGGGIMKGNGADPPLQLIIPQDSAFVGDTITALVVLGSGAVPGVNVLGAAFTLNYDAALIDSSSFRLDFGTSWIGDNSNSLDIYRNHEMAAMCDGAQVRSDHMAQTGSGQIATAHFIIIDNIDGKRAALDSALATIYFSNVRVITGDGDLIAINPIADSMMIYQLSTENYLPGPDQLVKAYPNPVTDILTVAAPSQTIETVEFWNLQGQLIDRKQPMQTERFRMRTEDLPAGMYFLKVQADGYWSSQRIIVQ